MYNYYTGQLATVAVTIVVTRFLLYCHLDDVIVYLLHVNRLQAEGIFLSLFTMFIVLLLSHAVFDGTADWSQQF